MTTFYSCPPSADHLLPYSLSRSRRSKGAPSTVTVFNKGLVFMRSDIDHYIAQLNLKSNDSFYQPCSNLDILRRVLRNLTLAFEKTGDSDKVKEIERMSAVLQEPIEE